MEPTEVVSGYLTSKRREWVKRMTQSQAGPGPNSRPANVVPPDRASLAREIKGDVSKGWDRLCEAVHALTHDQLITVATEALAVSDVEAGVIVILVVEALQTACA